MSRVRTGFRGKLSDGDITLLREFLEISAAGGITAAEHRLNKSKSAISIGLSKLEKRLGIRLCERGRSGFSLTEQGQLVHTAAEQLMDEIDRFSSFVGTASHHLEGEVSVMFDDSLIFEMERPIASVIAKMNELFPQMDLRVRMSSPDRILGAVLEGNADLGFTTVLQESHAIDIKPLFVEEMGIFCGNNHPLYYMDDKDITYADLQRHIFVRTDAVQTEELRQFLSGLSFSASAQTILSRMLLVLSSRYLGFIPLRFAEVWVQKGRAREIRISGSRVGNICSVIHRKSRPLGIGASSFRDILIAEVEAQVAAVSQGE